MVNLLGVYVGVIEVVDAIDYLPQFPVIGAVLLIAEHITLVSLGRVYYGAVVKAEQFPKLV
jgi:hypothetical protein